MSFCYLADENIDPDIVQGLRSREPAIDILDVKNAGLGATSDPDLLDIAAEQGRILITYDRKHNVATLLRSARRREIVARCVHRP